MSLQVGSVCYADLVSAAGAACASFPATSSIIGTEGKTATLTCIGVSDVGKLRLQTLISSPSVGTSPATSVATIVEVDAAVYPCQWDSYVQATELVIASLLVAWVGWYGIKKINDMVRWGRGDSL